MVITRDEIEAIKGTINKGDNIVIDTIVWADVARKEAIRRRCTVKGVYPHGVEVSFIYHNWKEEFEQTRWVSYVDILLAKANGKVPFINAGFASL